MKRENLENRIIDLSKRLEVAIKEGRDCTVERITESLAEAKKSLTIVEEDTIDLSKRLEVAIKEGSDEDTSETIVEAKKSLTIVEEDTSETIVEAFSISDSDEAFS